MEKCILYFDNGDNYKGDNLTVYQAKEYLRNKGYTIAYSGRKLNSSGMKVLVGIDGNNAIGLAERRKNGLWRATKIRL